jgi:GH15 family glucan-1,4-alpha-glucosidase
VRSRWNRWECRFHVLVSLPMPALAQMLLTQLTDDDFLTTCRPDFDSPSLFCRLLDKDKGGFFSITPPPSLGCTTKQHYLPSSCILQTRYIHEDGVVDLIDFFPRPKYAQVIPRRNDPTAFREPTSVQEELKKWLVRRVECVRGSLTIGMSFDYPGSG